MRVLSQDQDVRNVRLVTTATRRCQEDGATHAGVTATLTCTTRCPVMPAQAPVSDVCTTLMARHVSTVAVGTTETLADRDARVSVCTVCVFGEEASPKTSLKFVKFGFL